MQAFLVSGFHACILHACMSHDFIPFMHGVANSAAPANHVRRRRAHASMKHSCIPKENSILNRVLIGIVSHCLSRCQRNLCNEARTFEVFVRCFLCLGFGCAPVRALVFNEEFFACFSVFKPPCSCCHFSYLSLHYYYTTFGMFVNTFY